MTVGSWTAVGVAVTLNVGLEIEVEPGEGGAGLGLGRLLHAAKMINKTVVIDNKPNRKKIVLFMLSPTKYSWQAYPSGQWFTPYCLTSGIMEGKQWKSHKIGRGKDCKIMTFRAGPGAKDVGNLVGLRQGLAMSFWNYSESRN